MTRYGTYPILCATLNPLKTSTKRHTYLVFGRANSEITHLLIRRRIGGVGPTYYPIICGRGVDYFKHIRYSFFGANGNYAALLGTVSRN